MVSGLFYQIITLILAECVISVAMKSSAQKHLLSHSDALKGISVVLGYT